MKTTFCTLLAVGFISCAACLPAVAEPMGSDDNGKDYIIGDSDLSKWSVGGYYIGRERELKSEPHGFKLTQNQDAWFGYVGYQIFPIATIYLRGGDLGMQFEPTRYDTASFAWGGTLEVNLFHQELLDPTFIEDKLRLTATVGYNDTTIETQVDEYRYKEIEGSLILTLMNDIRGNKLFLPESIGYFGGPIVSQIDSDVISSSGYDRFGYTLGVLLQYSPRVSMNARLEQINSVGFGAGMNVKF